MKQNQKSYDQGYKDGQEALTKHFELCIEEIKAEIDDKSFELFEYDVITIEEIFEIIDKHISGKGRADV